MIFRSVISLALLLPASLAFVVPRAPVARDVTMSASRNENNQVASALSKLSVLPVVIAGMAGVGGLMPPMPAMADGSVSSGTIMRASALYGPRVSALKSAVEKGDIAAVKAEENAIVLFNSGAFALNRPLQKEVSGAYDEVAKAVKSGDAAALKSAWATYSSKAGLDKPKAFSSKDAGKIYSSDFDFKIYNKNYQ